MARFWLKHLGMAAVAAVALAGCGDKAETGMEQEALKARLAALMREAQEVQDIQAIKRLQHAYGYYIDEAQWDQVADLFADDASIEYGNEGVYKGKDHIRAYYLRLGGGKTGLERGQLNTFMQIMPVVRVAPDGMHAKARWRDMALTGHYGKDAFWGDGIYENEYVKENGVWKIAKLHRYTIFIAPYDGGWQNASGKPDISAAAEEVPADAPPTFDYTPFPHVYIAPYEVLEPFDGEAAAKPGIPSLPADASASAKALAAKADELESEIARLRAAEEIENLCALYGYYQDNFEWDKLADLFAEDGSIEIAARGVYVGKKSVRNNLDLYGKQGVHQNELHLHTQLQPIITVAEDGQSAKIRRRGWLEMGLHGKSAVWGEGLYEDEVVKVDGQWKFKMVHFYNSFFAPYEGGWEKVTEGRNPGINPDNPPDRPPTMNYDTFPKVYVLPFHYDNPVAGLIPPLKEPMPTVDDTLKDLASDYADLARDVERMSDVDQIENLQRAYGYYGDRKLWDQVVDLFADDGTYELAQRGVYVGKEHIRALLDKFGTQPIQEGEMSNHWQLQPVITVAPDGLTAKGRWHAFLQVGQPGRPGLWGLGVYENEYVKDRGVWKIKTFHFYQDMYTEYAKGWAESALPAPGPFEGLSPDRPPSVVYKAYPEVFIAPFHYKNPVTGQ